MAEKGFFYWWHGKILFILNVGSVTIEFLQDRNIFWSNSGNNSTKCHFQAKLGKFLDKLMISGIQPCLNQPYSGRMSNYLWLRLFMDQFFWTLGSVSDAFGVFEYKNILTHTKGVSIIIHRQRTPEFFHLVGNAKNNGPIFARMMIFEESKVCRSKKSTFCNSFQCQE